MGGGVNGMVPSGSGVGLAKGEGAVVGEPGSARVGRGVGRVQGVVLGRANGTGVGVV
jgi:hypothetical protein